MRKAILIFLLLMSLVFAQNIQHFFLPDTSIELEADLSYYDSIEEFRIEALEGGVVFNEELLNILNSSEEILSVSAILGLDGYGSFWDVNLCGEETSNDAKLTSCQTCTKENTLRVCAVSKIKLHDSRIVDLTGNDLKPIVYKFAISFADELSNVNYSITKKQKSNQSFVHWFEAQGDVTNYTVVYGKGSMPNSPDKLSLNPNLNFLNFNKSNAFNVSLQFDQKPKSVCSGLFCEFEFETTPQIKLEQNTLYYNEKTLEYFIVLDSNDETAIGVYAQNSEKTSKNILDPNKRDSLKDDVEPQLIQLSQEEQISGPITYKVISWPKILSIDQSAETPGSIELYCVDTPDVFSNELSDSNKIKSIQINDDQSNNQILIDKAELTSCKFMAALAYDEEGNYFGFDDDLNEPPLVTLPAIALL